MKTKLALLLAFLVTHFFTAAWAAEVVIPDAALKAAIWQTLGNPSANTHPHSFYRAVRSN